MIAADAHRHFYFWCPNCLSTLHLETAEHASDDSRGVEPEPWVNEPYCPMCGTETQDWDDIAAHDERFRNHGTWEDFAKWNSEQPKGECPKPWGEEP